VTAPDRVSAVAAIRALADFLEANPELPVPISVSAQHSIIGDNVTDEQLVAMVREAADHLAETPQIDDEDAAVTHVLNQWDPYVSYTVHGFRRPAGEPS